MPTVGFEPTTTASERPQTYAFDRAATGMGVVRIVYQNIRVHLFLNNVVYLRRRKNQRMTQVKMFIHFRLTQHVSGIIMPIVRRQTE